MRPFPAHGRENEAGLDGIYKFLYSQLVKDVVFVGSACDDLRSFPVDARQRAGYQLYLVQVGLDPTDWRPMASVGPGCREIRVRADPGAYRVLYLATIGDAVSCAASRRRPNELLRRTSTSPRSAIGR